MLNLLSRSLFIGNGSRFPSNRGRAWFSCSPVLRGENYYALLGIPEEFPVSSVQLSERFKHMQRQWHPDKFAKRAVTEQEQAADISSRLNVAYEVLRTPHRCAKHLLQLKKSSREGQPTAQADDQEVPLLADAELSNEFLMWIMQFREKLEESGDDLEKLNHLHQQLEHHVKQCSTDLSVAFEEDRLDDAMKETAKLQYYASIQQVFNNL